MARQLGTYSNVEVHRTIRFLWAKHFTSTEIHREISAVHGLHAMSRPVIVKWCKMFEDGRTDLTDVEWEGRPATVSTLEMSSGPILAIRARPGLEQLSAQPARERKKLYDQGPGPTMCMHEHVYSLFASENCL